MDEATKREEREIPWTVVRSFCEGKFSLGAFSSPHAVFELTLD